MPFASSIGITPPRFDLDYDEGQTYTFSFSVLNKAGKPTYIVMTADRSELAQYVEFSEEEFYMPPASTHPVTMTLTFPTYETLTEFGEQKIGFHATEVSVNKETGGFSALTAVEGWVVIQIPQPGKYGEITDFSISNVLQGLESDLKLEISNRGTEELTNTRATVDIFDFSGNLVSTLDFSNIYVRQDGKATISRDLLTSSYDSGKYIAEAKYYFNEEQAPNTKTTSFFIGSSDVIVTDYTQELVEGQINKIQVELQSLWGSPLYTIRGALTDFDGRQKPLPVIDLDPYQTKTVELYLDVPYLNSSIFQLSDQYNSTQRDLNFHLEFPVEAANDVEKDIPLTFTINRLTPAPELERPSIFTTTNTILIIGMVILILIALMLLFSFKKESHEHKGKK